MKTQIIKTRKVAGSCPDEVIVFFDWRNPPSRTMALGSTQPLTEMNTRNVPGGKELPARKADDLTAICEPIVYKMCELRRPTTLRASTACCRDSFTFNFYPYFASYVVLLPWNAIVFVSVVEILMLKPFDMFSSLLTALWKSTSDLLKIPCSSENRIILKTVLPILKSLDKASCHCLMALSMYWGHWTWFNLDLYLFPYCQPMFSCQFSFLCPNSFNYVIRESFILHYIPQLTSRYSIKRLLIVYKQYIGWQVEFTPPFFLISCSGINVQSEHERPLRNSHYSFESTYSLIVFSLRA
jgi:hypothetical protein